MRGEKGGQVVGIRHARAWCTPYAASMNMRKMASWFCMSPGVALMLWEVSVVPLVGSAGDLQLVI